MSGQAFAEAPQVTTPEIPAAISDDSINLLGFVRHYKDYYTIDSSYLTVMEDTNWDIWEDASVSVSVKNSEGPSTFDVIVEYRKDSSSSWKSAGSGSISLGGSARSFSIPENHSFRVRAKATLGKNGNATLNVSLC